MGVDPAVTPTLLVEELAIAFDVCSAFIAEPRWAGKVAGGNCGGDAAGKDVLGRESNRSSSSSSITMAFSRPILTGRASFSRNNSAGSGKKKKDTKIQHKKTSP